MILVDSSVWVSHFRRRNLRLEELLIHDVVFCHPYIIQEFACGNLHNRHEILELLAKLPSVICANHEDVLMFIEKHKLMGQGLSMVDIHLLISAFLSNTLIWTEDKPLSRISKTFKVHI